jgi:hypothetical protein
MTIVNPNGFCLGSPGPIGSATIYIFADVGDPNTRPDPVGLLAACSLGSTFQRTDGPDATHFLYVKTAPASVANPTGTWTNK